MKKRLSREFNKRVSKSGDCWIWTGSMMVSGYGRVLINGKNYSAHRLSWLIHYGDIPEGMCICHRCDVKFCVNPDHLFLGTHADNQKDCYEKGRRAKGARHGRNTMPERTARGVGHYRSKLDPDKVREIRAARGKISQQKLADKFGVPQTAISAVQIGKTWAHVI